MTEEEKSYKNLDVWKASREFVNSIYDITDSIPKEEIYGITNQIRRCDISIQSNIAVG